MRADKRFIYSYRGHITKKLLAITIIAAGLTVVSTAVAEYGAPKKTLEQSRFETDRSSAMNRQSISPSLLFDRTIKIDIDAKLDNTSGNDGATQIRLFILRDGVYYMEFFSPKQKTDIISYELSISLPVSKRDGKGPQEYLISPSAFCSPPECRMGESFGAEYTWVYSIDGGADQDIYDVSSGRYGIVINQSNSDSVNITLRGKYIGGPALK